MPFIFIITEVVLDEEPNNKLTAFERVGMENYLHSKHILEREHIDIKVGTTAERSVTVLWVILEHLF